MSFWVASLRQLGPLWEWATQTYVAPKHNVQVVDSVKGIRLRALHAPAQGRLCRRPFTMVSDDIHFMGLRIPYHIPLVQRKVEPSL